MKKYLLPILLLLIAIASWWLVRGDLKKPVAPQETPPIPEEANVPAKPDDETHIGDEILANYGDESSTTRDDLQSVSNLVENFSILANANGSLPLGSNGDFVDALRGRNSRNIKMLKDQLPFVSADGEFLDRFGKPLFFHVDKAGRVAIRSAGPDQVMWTEDDIHREADGSYLQGEQLLETSLGNKAK